jgi:hypothetical protein
VTALEEVKIFIRSLVPELVAQAKAGEARP